VTLLSISCAHSEWRIIRKVSETTTFEKPEDRIFLTVDFDGDFMGLSQLASDFNDRIHAVKLPQGFPLDTRAAALNKHLVRDANVSTYLDLKILNHPEQVEAVTRKVFELGYRYVSVAPIAGAAALVRAGLQQGGGSVVASLSNEDQSINLSELENIRSANQELETEFQLTRVMCNVSSIERVKAFGNFSVLATGIRMPEDDVHDQPAVATPEEALAMGADYLAIGRAITAHKPGERLRAFERILENIASLQ
jgi:orotidine-5'-phosphate decarboxylase